MFPGQTVEADYAAAAQTGALEPGISWGAVIAGGLTAAAISLILLLFGAGLGLASISPWTGAGVSLPTFTVFSAIWLIIVQWVAALFGGYMAGRLRRRWAGVHADEVFFRDTAHGFLAWALGTLIAAFILAASAGTAASTGAHAAAALPAAARNYDVDLLFRVNPNPLAPASALAQPVNPPAMTDDEFHATAAAILAQGAATGGVNPTDSAYLANLVSQKTGLAPADAQTRVNDVLAREQTAVTEAKQAADAARKAASGAAIYTFISLLIGAFIASVAGALGGRWRDQF
jgi:hypothetical protein